MNAPTAVSLLLPNLSRAAMLSPAMQKPLSLPVGEIAERSSHRTAELRGIGVVLTSVVIVALLLSTEFLFQPFVWRNYELADIFAAWFTILRDRLVVALAIGIALALTDRLRVGGLKRRAFLQIGAVILGATLGEALLGRIDTDEGPQGVASLLGAVARWSIIGAACATMLYVWRSAANLAAEAGEARADAARSRRLAAAGRIEALQRQIEPHFLFNTLATIRSLHSTDPSRGQLLLARLLELMSKTLGSGAAARTTLGGEIELVRAYLEVCAARMGGGLELRCDVPDRLLDRDFPSLALSTLAENAVKHGVGPRDGGKITIATEERAAGLEVSLSDDGAGFSEKSEGRGIGLANIAERLRLLHGSDAEVRLQPNPGGGVRASLWLPA